MNTAIRATCKQEMVVQLRTNIHCKCEVYSLVRKRNLFSIEHIQLEIILHYVQTDIFNESFIWVQYIKCSDT